MIKYTRKSYRNYIKYIKKFLNYGRKQRDTIYLGNAMRPEYQEMERSYVECRVKNNMEAYKDG